MGVAEDGCVVRVDSERALDATIVGMTVVFVVAIVVLSVMVLVDVVSSVGFVFFLWLFWVGAGLFGLWLVCYWWLGRRYES